MLNAEVHDISIRRRLNKYNLFGRFAKRKRLLSKGICAQLSFTKQQQTKRLLEQYSMDRRDQMELYGLILEKTEHSISAETPVKHGAGRVMIWACF